MVRRHRFLNARHKLDVNGLINKFRASRSLDYMSRFRSKKTYFANGDIGDDQIVASQTRGKQPQAMRTPTYIPRVHLILSWPSPLLYSDAHKDCIDRGDDPATYTDTLAHAIKLSYFGPYWSIIFPAGIR